MKYVFRLFVVVALIIGVFGFVTPPLLSARDNTFVAVGFGIWFATAFVIVGIAVNTGRDIYHKLKNKDLL